MTDEQLLFSYMHGPPFQDYVNSCSEVKFYVIIPLYALSRDFNIIALCL